MLVIGEKTEEEYFELWKTYNPEVDFSSWAFTDNGIVDQGNGHMLMFIWVNDSRSLLSLKKNAQGKFFLNCGISGPSFVNIIGKKKGGAAAGGSKRKIGYNVPNPKPKK